jgi:cytidylate kinase
MKPKIAIDGPAGAGKSSVARGIARELDYTYIDTGAIYRAIAYLAMQEGLHPDTGPEQIGDIAGSVNVEFRRVGDGQHIFVNGEDLEEEVRRPEVGAMSSPVSAIPLVRENLLQLQRDLAATGGCVMEGRDIGTVVLPDAEMKIFLTATPEERARRRFEQIKDENPDLTYEQVLANQKARDERDRSREIAPLKKADDATEFVTDGLSLEEVIAHLVQMAREVETGSDV